MKKKISIIVLFCFCFLIIGTEFVIAQEMQRRKQTVAVMNFVAMDELSQKEANLYTERIILEFDNYPPYSSLSQTYIANKLRQANIDPSDCQSPYCAVRAGKVLDAPFVLIGSLSKFGSLFTIEMQMVSVDQGEVVNTVQENYTGNEFELLDHLSATIPKLISDLPIQIVQTPSATEEETTETSLKTTQKTEMDHTLPQQQPSQNPIQIQQVKKKGGSKLKYIGLVLLAGAGAALYFLKFEENGKEDNTDETTPSSPLPTPPTFPKK